MCEKKLRKITKGSQLTRLREARRLYRINNMTPSPTVRDGPNPSRMPHIVLPIDKAVQNKVILELAWKTIALMHKNKLIQQKIIALQKETSDFVAAITRNPENRQRYVEHMRAQENAEVRAEEMTVDNKENVNFVIKTEPDDA